MRYNWGMTETSKDRIERIREQIRSFPTGPGVYLMKDAQDRVLYIGKAAGLRSRAASYFQPSAKLAESRGPWIVEMVEKVETVEYLETPSEVEAILQEARLIKDIHPPYNTDLKDAKTFPYLEITTRQEFPGAYITRNPQDPRSRLFGPFTSVNELRAAFLEMQKIFRFRTCNLDIRSSDEKRRFFRPCILYNIKQCTAPCADKISKAEYKKNIANLVQFLQSKRTAVLRDFKKQMAAASARLDYETAAVYRDRIKLMESLDKRGLADVHIQPESFRTDPTEALVKLQEIVQSPRPIRIIEGFDIAHLAGEDTVGSLVQFIDGKPFKDGYRKFKIKTVVGVDDYACLQEVLTRRYKRAASGEELWPDLVLIDGGLGQLHAAKEVFEKMNVPMPNLLSLAKREEEIFIHGREKPLKLPATSPVRKLMQYVRDEAHRFAQHYHHLLRSKKLLESD
jgi:excinuclease ABC subunit C